MELETIKLSEKNRIFITLVLAIISGISYKSTNSKIKKKIEEKNITLKGFCLANQPWDRAS